MVRTNMLIWDLPCTLYDRFLWQPCQFQFFYEFFYDCKLPPDRRKKPCGELGLHLNEQVILGNLQLHDSKATWNLKHSSLWHQDLWYNNLYQLIAIKMNLSYHLQSSQTSSESWDIVLWARCPVCSQFSIVPGINIELSSKNP